MNLSYIRTFSNILELDEKNEPQYLPLRQVYLGMEAHDSMALLSCDKQTELDLVYRAARDFYVEAIAQIKARFKFEDPIFEFTKVLDPKDTKADRLVRALHTLREAKQNRSFTNCDLKYCEDYKG
ncbi:hypothetical protein QYM36_008914 [Artemia franciscana]|uniref:Uncharacterized protein n=1 Tax=Artemia franciscana TaxID=6661 RepID=A0AA88HQ70_ARTSF|nr:hypothetical protein QYM36_008914 [Artemia franciscana]